MNCFSKKTVSAFICPLPAGHSRSRTQPKRTIGATKNKGFSLAETLAALLILGFISGSVLVVVNRYMASAVDSVLRMQAFEVARANMEKLLTLNTVQESVEYGTSELYLDIQYQTVVESFYEPVTSAMWIQAVCSAEYIDSQGEVQTVELKHWLTDVSKAEMLKILEQQESELAGEVIETIEEAAEYAGVDEQTIEQWVDDGMLLTDEGYFTTDQLDLYLETDGNPTIEDMMRLYPEKVVPADGQTKPSVPLGPDGTGGRNQPFQKSPPARVPPEIPENMTPDELMQWVSEFFKNQ